jgi:hypothetical protein
MPQNHDHDQQEEENNEKEEEEGNKAEGEMMKTTLLGAMPRRMKHSTGKLRDLLNHINITTPLEFRFKRIPCPS